MIVGEDGVGTVRVGSLKVGTHRRLEQHRKFDSLQQRRGDYPMLSAVMSLLPQPSVVRPVAIGYPLWSDQDRHRSESLNSPGKIELKAVDQLDFQSPNCDKYMLQGVGCRVPI